MEPEAGTPSETKSLKRRGLIAAGAALAAGALAKVPVRPAAAGHNQTNICHLGVTNVATSATWISCIATTAFVGDSGAGEGLIGISRQKSGVTGASFAPANEMVEAKHAPSGVKGSGEAYGVTGHSKRTGVYGESTAYGTGVWGKAANSGTGVHGEANGNLGTGVHGEANGNLGTGVYGVAKGNRGTAVRGAATGNSGTAVRGEANGNLGIGVHGEATGNSGTAVRGEATGSGSGVYGTSVSGHGVSGFSANDYGVRAFSGGHYGLYASSAAALAGYFDGAVFVTGDFTATGAKSAAVPHPDGSYRRLYAVESPESWFEDFGETQLENGQAEVAIDPDFADLVHGDTYQVFLTPYAACNGLYVNDRHPAGFTVRELHDGTSNVGFGYRLVAKRKDVNTPRLERVKLPDPPARVAT